MYLKKIAIKGLIGLLSALGLLCSPSYCFGQDDRDLKEFDNRFEGSTTEMISGSANLQLISLVSYFQDFEWYKDQELKIRFYLEEAKPINILVQQTKGNIIYRMKPKQFPTAKGANEFGPWPVDDVLSTLEMTKNKLGVTITDGEKSVLYPAAVYHSRDSLNFKGYIFEFLPGKNLTKIKFSLYKGLFMNKEVNTDSIAFVQDLKNRTKHGGEPFQLAINRSEMEVDPDWQGWMTLTMKAKDNVNYSNVEAIYFFYHDPQLKPDD